MPVTLDATVTVTENAETHALEAQVAYSKGGKAADFWGYYL